MTNRSNFDTLHMILCKQIRRKYLFRVYCGYVNMGHRSGRNIEISQLSFFASLIFIYSYITFILHFLLYPYMHCRIHGVSQYNISRRRPLIIECFFPLSSAFKNVFSVVWSTSAFSFPSHPLFTTHKNNQLLSSVTNLIQLPCYIALKTHFLFLQTPTKFFRQTLQPI